VVLAELYTGKLQNTKGGDGKVHVHYEECLDDEESACFIPDTRAPVASMEALEQLRELAVCCLGPKQATKATKRKPAKPARPSLQDVKTKLADLEQLLRPACVADLKKQQDWQARSIPVLTSLGLDMNREQHVFRCEEPSAPPNVLPHTLASFSLLCIN
jgi:hypothetical protein